jgi:bifunctional non-homologous end joining protein LigD
MPKIEAAAIVAGIRISHPDRLIYPDLGISKLQLARYYDEISEWILPHVRGRPLTLVHCPAGIEGPCMFLKHAKAWGPTALRRVRIQEKTKVGEYLVADSIAAVVALAQMGIVEIHTWNSVANDVDRPNRLVWDLDPGPEVPWTQTVAAAILLREVLTTLGLKSWVKMTGGRGLHIVMPIMPSLGWSECLDYSRDVAHALARMEPSLYTTSFRKHGREEKILIDYLRNNRTNTSICAYSPRARQSAPVSLPLSWRDLRTASVPPSLPSVWKALRRRRIDPWQEYWASPQRISSRSRRALGQL